MKSRSELQEGIGSDLLEFLNGGKNDPIIGVLDVGRGQGQVEPDEHYNSSGDVWDRGRVHGG